MTKDYYLGLTYGDPASIGPEILQKTLLKWDFKFKPLIIGLRKYIGNNSKNLNNKVRFHFPPVLFQEKNDFKLGKPTKFTGSHSYFCLREAIKLLKNKDIVGLVTGPVSKKAINLAKIKFVGQTEELAKSFKISSKKTIMIFIAHDLRIALYSRHIPLKKVPKAVDEDTLRSYLVLLNQELKKWFKIKQPKIAILGLNPHASEDGIFGDEENKIIKPVVKELSLKGINVFGPFSPDATLATAGQDFLLKKKQKYDAYVSFYHDQCLPMFKAVAGLKGVNVTLGLPYLRVSVDHGTAFDIAGKNKASNEGLLSAIRLMEELLL